MSLLARNFWVNPYWFWPGLVLFSCAAFAACVPPGLAENPREPPALQPAPNEFTAGPYLIRSKPGEMLVVMKANVARAPVVHFWTVPDRKQLTPPAPGMVRQVKARLQDELWVAALNGLPLDTLTAYQIDSERGLTEPAAFKAGATRGKEFRFAAFGDTRTNHDVHQAVVDAVSQEDVDFFVHTGDMVERGGREWQWELFFRIEGPLLKKAPIFPAIGNHDISPRNYYGEYFLTWWWSDDLAYYYQDWGDLRIVSVDAGIECRDGCVQNWFARRALAEGAKNGMLMLMILHQPPYSSGAHGSDEYVQGAVEGLATEYGVELVIAGHDHNYERTKLIKGVTYVVSGAAGAPIRPVKKQHFSEVVRTEPHYVVFDVNSDRLALRAINVAGETFDAAIIQARPPSKGKR